MKNAAMRPPENTIRTEICFTVSRISSAAECLPESSRHFLTADISPAKLNVALIADFIQNYRLMVFLAPLIYQLGGTVCLRSLDAAMGNPGQVIIIIRFAVMNGSEMMVRILLTDNAGISFPVRKRKRFLTGKDMLALSVRRILIIISDLFITAKRIMIITCPGSLIAVSRELRHTAPPSW